MIRSSSLVFAPRWLFAALLGFLSVSGLLGTESKPAVPIDGHTLDKHTTAVLKVLNLEPEKQLAVRHTLEAHLQAVQAWHVTHGEELATLWNAWAAARTPPHKDETKAGEIARQIDDLFATLRPQHAQFVTALAAELSPTQIEQVKDAMTKSPGLPRTYHAYLQMIPTFTAEQKAFIHQKLELAREQALDAASEKETVSLFKKRKVEIEAYIDAQGLDYKTAYKAFTERLKDK
jgi:hypothetical protein